MHENSENSAAYPGLKCFLVTLSFFSMPRPILINRCVCSRVLFQDLKDDAEHHGIRSMQELQKVREFGVNCKLCHPYVRRMLKDGTTEFADVITDDEV
ncbi:MAG: hypothetical protein O3A57_06690 [Bacteroidetes bacterium]|nr:hypothetical protein [Bacteroidota bacterium]